MVLADAQKRFYDLKYPKTNNSQNLLHIGTDEHGQKIAEAAKKLNLQPQKMVNFLAEDFKILAKNYEINYNDFIRTTEPRHVKNVKNIWNKLKSNGDISLSEYSGWYCASDETFVQERDTQLITDPNGLEKRVLKENPNSKVEWFSEENYTFNLEKYLTSNDFIKFLENNVTPYNGQKLANSHLEKLLNDTGNDDLNLSISRPIQRLDWAIKVPNDENQGIYVWLDALSNYLTTSPPNTYSEQLHIIGQDITKFHCLYWPAFLQALDIDIMKHKVHIHGHWTVDGIKMSKSLGNVIDPINSEFIKLIPENNSQRSGTLRWFLLKKGPNSKLENATFRKDLVINEMTKDMTEGIGTLLSRICSKSGPGKWPNREEVDFNISEIEIYLNEQSKIFQNYDKNSENLDWNNSIQNLSEITSLVHTTLAKVRPFNLEDLTLRYTWFAVFYETLRCLAIISQPVIPEMSQFIFKRLGIDKQHELCGQYSKAYQNIAFFDTKTSNNFQDKFYPKNLENLPIKLPKQFKQKFMIHSDLEAMLKANISADSESKNSDKSKPKIKKSKNKKSKQQA